MITVFRYGFMNWRIFGGSKGNGCTCSFERFWSKRSAMKEAKYLNQLIYEGKEEIKVIEG